MNGAGIGVTIMMNTSTSTTTSIILPAAILLRAETHRRRVEARRQAAILHQRNLRIQTTTMTTAGTITLTVPGIATVHHPVEARLLPVVVPHRPAVAQDHPPLEATAVAVPLPLVVPAVGRLRLVLLAVRTLLLLREAMTQAVVEAEALPEAAGHQFNF